MAKRRAATEESCNLRLDKHTNETLRQSMQTEHRPVDCQVHTHTVLFIFNDLNVHNYTSSMHTLVIA